MQKEHDVITLHSQLTCSIWHMHNQLQIGGQTPVSFNAYVVLFSKQICLSLNFAHHIGSVPLIYLMQITATSYFWGN